MMKILAAALFIVFVPWSALAQQPRHKSEKAQAPETPVKSSKRVPCAEYGPGFVRVPNTNACIKVGGSIDVQGQVR
ncbi:MAG TPA: hypothetical protein VFL51_07055 [Pseudolabrys sp.]|nr:hypothetical protein [Pseudolabrys sp.]